MEELLKLIELLKGVGITPNVNIEILVDLPGNEEEEAPPPADEKFVFKTVTAEPRANLRFASSYNAAGRPVMQIYPKDTAPVSDRVQYNSGTGVVLKADVVKADGGGLYWALDPNHTEFGKTFPQLYLRNEDVS